MNTAGKILVTGGTGYIGSHTVVELQTRGYEVSIIDNLTNSHESVLGAISKISGTEPRFYRTDLCDKAALDDYFRREKPDAIIHFAAFKSVGESVKQPLKYYKNNLLSLINLLNAAQEHNIDSFLFSSSCSVYGQTNKLPIDEETALGRPESPYANTKKIGEEVLAATVHSSSLNAIALRYFNPVGAHDSVLIGEQPTGTPDNLVPLITRTAIGRQTELQVFGNDYDTPDGSCIRDFIHVVDIAKAHVIAIERLLKKQNKSAYEVFNLGTGKGYSVLETIRVFEKITGRKLHYRIAPRRAGDVPKIYADTHKANNFLGWKAEKTLEEMLLSAWKWEQQMQLAINKNA